jgi:hypothetical protein
MFLFIGSKPQPRRESAWQSAASEIFGPKSADGENGETNDSTLIMISMAYDSQAKRTSRFCGLRVSSGREAKWI